MGTSLGCADLDAGEFVCIQNQRRKSVIPAREICTQKALALTPACCSIVTVHCACMRSVWINMSGNAPYYSTMYEKQAELAKLNMSLWLLRRA